MRLTCSLLALNAVGAFVPTFTNHHRQITRYATVAKEIYGFEEIQSLDSRLETLEQDAPDVLGCFYEPHLKSFSIKPGSVEVSSLQIADFVGMHARTDHAYMSYS